MDAMLDTMTRAMGLALAPYLVILLGIAALIAFVCITGRDPS